MLIKEEVPEVTQLCHEHNVITAFINALVKYLVNIRRFIHTLVKSLFTINSCIN